MNACSSFTDASYPLIPVSFVYSIIFFLPLLHICDSLFMLHEQNTILHTSAHIYEFTYSDFWF